MQLHAMECSMTLHAELSCHELSSSFISWANLLEPDACLHICRDDLRHAGRGDKMKGSVCCDRVALFTRGLPLRIVMIGTLTGLQWGIYDAFKVYVGL